ncbi:MAG: hypothetical protein A3C47_06135 [Omnitrophica bacterium RIFCSPHIGHO2_02_FULL_51_18]|nr:MAG: hypothetical protein A3C47_06135 [Omnitrophica bacterium RIFCSPHIGHO2_02_FULL_51_18]
MSFESELQSKLQKIKLFITDIDGVLTDGRIIFGNYGDELKFFDVHDGFGLVMLRRMGFKTIIITAKKSRINVKRAKEVQAVKLYQNAKDKLKVFEKVLKQFRVEPQEVCFIGDDLMDIPVLKRVGFAVAVQNAVQEVKGLAHYVTQKNGGRGAVREVVDMILRAQDKWAEATVNYFR